MKNSRMKAGTSAVKVLTVEDSIFGFEGGNETE